jgi:hypothetical protein
MHSISFEIKMKKIHKEMCNCQNKENKSSWKIAYRKVINDFTPKKVLRSLVNPYTAMATLESALQSL